MKIWQIMAFVGVTALVLGLPTMLMAALIHLEWMIRLVDTAVPGTWWNTHPILSVLIHALIAMSLVMLEIATALLVLATMIAGFVTLVGHYRQLEGG